MGRLYDIIQVHIDAQPYEVAERQIARRLGVSQTTLSNWRSPKKLIDKEHLRAISGLTGVPYQRVLDALLDDIGYLREDEVPTGKPSHVEVAEAVGKRVKSRQKSSGGTGSELSDSRDLGSANDVG